MIDKKISKPSIRQKAERIINAKSIQVINNLDTISADKIRNLVHELQVHQIELEMQNDELLKSQRELYETKKRYFDLYELAPIGYFTLSIEGLIQEANLTASKLLALTRNKLINKPFSHFIQKEYQDIYYLFRKKLFESHEYTECELQLIKGDKTVFWAHISATIQMHDNKLECRLLLNNITQRKKVEEKLLHIAHYDELTDLPNRVILADRLQQNMIQVKRKNQSLAVIFLDIDGFKDVNDNYGHDVGDKLLIALAKQMKDTLREEDTLSRIGGDEFIVILSDLSDINSSLPLISRLLEAAAKEIYIDDLRIQVSASLGISFYPQSEEIDPDQLLRQADQAMYQAKISGKNCYHIFNIEQDDFIRERFEYIQRLREALNENEFILFYQPKVNMRTGKVIGVEALIRWEHPQKGLVQPDDFLPLVEGHDLSISIGEFVIKSVLSQIEAWQSLNIKIPVSINIAARQLLEDDFFEQFEKILLEFPKVDASLLEIEVLETSKLEDLSKASKVINRFKKLGVNFSLDDFGTGYSSMTYLKKLPITHIKIDQSFVSNMLKNPNDLAILESVIKLSSAFRINVIAEGVETLEHSRVLLQLGCELAQGYIIACPMRPDKFPKWLKEWKPDKSWTNQSLLSEAQGKSLFATVEHRAWIANLHAFLKNKIKTFEIQNIHECNFSQWLDTYGDNYFKSSETLTRVKYLHKSIHNLSLELFEFHKNDQKQELLQGIKKLYSLQEKMLIKISIGDTNSLKKEYKYD